MNWSEVLTKNIDHFSRNQGILIDVDADFLPYDHIAPFYDDTRPAYPQEMFEYLWAQKIIKPGDLLLDAGCGTGRSSLNLIKTCPIKLIGIDISLARIIHKFQKSSGRFLSNLLYIR